jgi:hypothetical protein
VEFQNFDPRAGGAFDVQLTLLDDKEKVVLTEAGSPAGLAGCTTARGLRCAFHPGHAFGSGQFPPVLGSETVAAWSLPVALSGFEHSKRAGAIVRPPEHTRVDLDCRIAGTWDLPRTGCA